MNDLPKVCSNVDIFLFADDTNITAIGCSDAEISMDLIKIEKWLIANKLVLNSSKTYQLDFMDFRSASNQSFMLKNTAISVVPMCKYLGVCLDSKFSFQSHIDSVRQRLGKLCSIISKLRHYVPRKQLLRYYDSNVKSIIQYGILVYGCCSFISISAVLALQKVYLFQKTVRLFYGPVC